MGQLTNQYVSQSYQGLIKLADSTTGVTSTLQYTQDGLGNNLPLQISTTQVNITGSLTVNGQPITFSNTGSFATTGSNVFQGNQIITGSVNITGQYLVNGVPISGGSGTSGTSGTSGSNGSSGTSGISGTSGTSGQAGTSGTSGVNGTSGTSGSSGTSGTSGDNGSSGTSGTSGDTGSSGTSGTSGAVGATGSSGTSGTSGVNGTSGTSGVNGTSGTSGTSGSNGSSGTSGTAGTSGTSGTSGSSGQSNSLFPYNARTNITSGNPGNTNIIWNNATQSGATEINVSHLDRNNDDIDVFLGLIPSGSTIIIQDQNNSTNFQKWIVGTGVEAAPNSYWTFPITYVSGGHQFTNGENILFIIGQLPSGTSGTSGTSGANGSSGTSGTSGIDGTSGTSGTSGVGTSGTSGTSGASPFAQTGSFYNTTNNIGITGSLVVRGADLDIISNNTTVNIDLYQSNSLAGQSNIILGWGDNPGAGGPGATQSNYTGSLRITGSNNIMALPQIRATGLGGGADQTGYISGSNNIIITNQGGIYLNTGSLLFPKTQGNIINSPNAIRLDFTTSSLSGGHPVINQNILNGGFLTITHNSGSAAVINNLIIGGSVTSTQAFETNTRPSIANNMINGLITLNHISSSINYTNNLGNAGVTVNNHLSSSGIANNSLTVNNNTFLGNNAGLQGRVGIYVSGSQSSNLSRTISDNLIGGRQNVISSSFVSSSSSNLTATIIYGNSLAVSASHSGDGGSAFFGRFNAIGSLQESTQDTVFVVGVGISSGVRRNALRIDSNSTSTFTGSVQISGSLTLNGVAVGSGDRNGLITTGSAGGTQSITGSLIVSGSESITGSISILSGSVNITNGGIVTTTTDNTATSTIINNTYEIRNTATSLIGTQSGSVIQITYNSGSNLSQFAMSANISGTTGELTILNNAGVSKVRSTSDTVLFAKQEGFPNTSATSFEVDANNIILSGSVNVTGSVSGNVNALSISSQTASLNLNNGNFFTLQLVSGSATHIEPSNIKPGQTVNIRLSTTGSGTVTFPSSVDQASGSAYVPTTTTGTDIITLVSFDSSTLYLANVKNLI